MTRIIRLVLLLALASCECNGPRTYAECKTACGDLGVWRFSPYWDPLIAQCSCNIGSGR